jgi:hypothetical protein
MPIPPPLLLLLLLQSPANYCMGEPLVTSCANDRRKEGRRRALERCCCEQPPNAMFNKRTLSKINFSLLCAFPGWVGGYIPETDGTNYILNCDHLSTMIYVHCCLLCLPPLFPSRIPQLEQHRWQKNFLLLLLLLLLFVLVQDRLFFLLQGPQRGVAEEEEEEILRTLLLMQQRHRKVEPPPSLPRPLARSTAGWLSVTWAFFGAGLFLCWEGSSWPWTRGKGELGRWLGITVATSRKLYF